MVLNAINTKLKDRESEILKIDSIDEESNTKEIEIKSKELYKEELEHLLSYYTTCKNLSSEEDRDVCKKLLSILNKSEIESNIVLKICSFIISRFTDGRVDFNDRACFIATELFKKDSFNIIEKESYSEFKDLITVKINEKKQLTPLNQKFSVVTNESARISFKDYQATNMLYHSTYNPVFIQKALKILKEDKDINAIRSVHFNFEKMLDNTTDRLFSCIASDLFDQLSDLTHRDLFDIQFKSLAYLMARDMSYFDKALDIFTRSKSETLKTFLIYSFCHCQEILPMESKVKLHLKFGEAISIDDVILEPSVREAAIKLVEAGIIILNEYENNSSK